MKTYLTFTFTVIAKPVGTCVEPMENYFFVKDPIGKLKVAYLYNKKLSCNENLKLISDILWNQDFIEKVEQKIKYLYDVEYYSITTRLDIRDVPPVEIELLCLNIEYMREFFKGNRFFEQSYRALLTTLHNDGHIDYFLNNT